MRAKIALLLMIIALVVYGLPPAQPKTGDCMAIETTGIQDQRIRWPGNVFSGLSQMTVLIWAKSAIFVPAGGVTIADLFGKYTPDSLPVGGHVLFTFHIAVDVTGAQAGKVDFLHYWQTGTAYTGGYWRTTNVVFTDGVPYHAGFTYDRGSTANDPVIYINGASVPITEVSTPAGVISADNATDKVSIADLLDNATLAGSDVSNKGYIYSVNVYNRIMTAAEILDAYNSKLMVPNYRGLVFSPQLCGANGLQVFENTTLGAGNTIVDEVTGIAGVPAGSPIGRMDTLLNVGK